MDKPTKNDWYNYLHQQGEQIANNPTLTRNDFIRPFRKHKIHLERMVQKELFQSTWQKREFVVNPVSRFIPFKDILRTANFL